MNMFVCLAMVKQEQAKHSPWRVRKVLRVVLGTKYVITTANYKIKIIQ